MAGRPKEFDPDEALSAAAQLFWSRGYEASSMAMLVEQMDLNRQSVYDTFGDKRALFMEALRQYTDEAGSRLREALTTGPSPLGRVRKFLRAVGERAADGQRRGCLLTNTIVEIGPHDPEIRAYVSGVLKRVEDALAATLKEAAAAGELHSGAKPAQLAKFILVVMQGALVLAKTDLTASIEDALDVAERALVGD